jgi:hypothetical protein
LGAHLLHLLLEPGVLGLFSDFFYSICANLSIILLIIIFAVLVAFFILKFVFYVFFAVFFSFFLFKIGLFLFFFAFFLLKIIFRFFLLKIIFTYLACGGRLKVKGQFIILVIYLLIMVGQFILFFPLFISILFV